MLEVLTFVFLVSLKQESREKVSGKKKRKRKHEEEEEMETIESENQGKCGSKWQQNKCTCPVKQTVVQI